MTPPTSYPPPPPSYPPVGGPTPGAGKNNTLGLIAMIVGIVAVVGACCRGYSIPLGVAAVVLGFLGKQKVDKGEADNGSQAMTGIILGIVSVVLAIGSIVFWNTVNVADWFINNN